jgi:hypothetical protein
MEIYTVFIQIEIDYEQTSAEILYAGTDINAANDIIKGYRLPVMIFNGYLYLETWVNGKSISSKEFEAK